MGRARATRSRRPRARAREREQEKRRRLNSASLERDGFVFDGPGPTVRGVGAQRLGRAGRGPGERSGAHVSARFCAWRARACSTQRFAATKGWNEHTPTENRPAALSLAGRRQPWKQWRRLSSGLPARHHSRLASPRQAHLAPLRWHPAQRVRPQPSLAPPA
jgi:hypothetical protein